MNDFRSRLERLRDAVPELPEPEPEPVPRVLMTEAQVMRAAFEALDGGVELDWDRISVVPARRAEPVADNGPSDPPPRTGASRMPAPPSPAVDLHAEQWVGASWDQPDHVPTPLPESLAILQRSRSASVATVNLHGLGRVAALAQLETFCVLARAAGFRFARIITGKGLGSPAGPVLKPAVVEWTADSRHVVAWAGERDDGGDYGAVIVQLRTARR